VNGDDGFSVILPLEPVRSQHDRSFGVSRIASERRPDSCRNNDDEDDDYVVEVEAGDLVRHLGWPSTAVRMLGPVGPAGLLRRRTHRHRKLFSS
jgi:hypothetical protein